MIHRSRLLLAAVVVAVASSGCAINPHTAVNWDDVELKLQPGMTHEQVALLLGEPVDIRNPSTADGSGGIVTWVYKRKHRVGSTMAVTGSVDVPYVDPFTGMMKTVPEPTYSQVVTMAIEEFHLYWKDGLLYQWQRFARGEVEYDQ